MPDGEQDVELGKGGHLPVKSSTSFGTKIISPGNTRPEAPDPQFAHELHGLFDILIGFKM